MLPPGLTPVAAGRAGLWLLSRRAYRAARKRDAHSERVWPDAAPLAARCARLLAPWHIDRYPGTERALAAICGVARQTAAGWLYRRRESLPAKHARALADHLEARAAQARALALELRDHAEKVNVHSHSRLTRGERASGGRVARAT